MDPLRSKHPCGDYSPRAGEPAVSTAPRRQGLLEKPIWQLRLFGRGVPSFLAQERLKRQRGVAETTAPDDQPYRCARCEVYGRGGKCWCCDSEDLERASLPFLDSAMTVESVLPVRDGVRSEAIRASEEFR